MYLVTNYTIIIRFDFFRWTLNIYFNNKCTNYLKTISTSCGIYCNDNKYNTQVLCEGSSSCPAIGSVSSILL